MTVGEVARFSEISVRTLHHYDEIGLLKPTSRHQNGYRLYTDSDIERLMQILTYRELGLGLDEIARIQSEPQTRTDALTKARARVYERIERLTQIAKRLSSALEEATEGTHMTAAERLEVFDGFNPDDVAQEADDRWGDTEVFVESIRRTNSYSAADWRRQKSAEADIYARIGRLITGDIPPSSDQALAVVDAHRAMITEWFYDCTPQIHESLGQMYVADPRFTENINNAGAGIAEYLCAAIAARYSN